MGELKTLIHSFDDLWAEIKFDKRIDEMEAGDRTVLEVEVHAMEWPKESWRLYHRMDEFRLAAARLGYWAEFRDIGNFPGIYIMIASRVRSLVGHTAIARLIEQGEDVDYPEQLKGRTRGSRLRQLKGQLDMLVPEESPES